MLSTKSSYFMKSYSFVPILHDKAQPFAISKLSLAMLASLLVSGISPTYALDGNENGGHVDIPKETVIQSQDVYGYFVTSETAEDVKGGLITISGEVIGGRIIGGSSLYGQVIDNAVIVNGGTVNSAALYGGRGQGTQGNQVKLAGATVNADIYGGAVRGSIGGLNNSVQITEGSTVEGSLYGARSQESDLTSNTVTINDSQVTIRRSEAIYGAYTNLGDVTGNSIDISDSSIEKTGDSADFIYLMGGSTAMGDANQNTVTIRNSQVLRNAADCEGIAGGVSTEEGNVLNNTVRIIESEIVGNTMGGQAYAGAADGNTVEIRNSSVAGDIYGGYSYSDVADRNRVMILNESETAYDRVTGGQALISANGNIVSIDINGTVQEIVGGSSQNQSDSNLVLLRGEAHTSEVIGGSSWGFNSTDSASRNILDIGGRAEVDNRVIGGFASMGLAEGNVVQIRDNSKVTGLVYGGYSRGSATDNGVIIAGNATVNGSIYGAMGQSVSNNLVAVNSGKVTGNIYGGYALGGAATGNAVLIGAGADVSESRIFGGFSQTQSTFVSNSQTNTTKQTADVSGNRLVIADSGVKTKSIENFDSVQINVTDLSHAALTLTDQQQASLDNTSLTVRFNTVLSGSQGTLKKGQQWVLIDSGETELNFAEVNTAGELVINQGTSLTHRFELSESGNEVTLVSTEANDSSAILSTGRLGVMTALVQANNLAMSVGMQRALTLLEKEQHGLYIVGSADNLRLDSDKGSETQVDGLHWLVGSAQRVNFSGSRQLDTNVYVQVGSADVKGDKADVKGSGDSSYYGFGATMRYWLNEGLYAQVNAQAGRASVDFKSTLADVDGTSAKIDKETTYYGLGALLGYRIQWPVNISLDLSASYQWLHLKGFSDTVAYDPYTFDSIDSRRAIVAAHMVYTGSTLFSPYAGLSWEHEFDAKANASSYGLSLEELSLKGDTGAAELGVRFKPSENSSWRVDASVNGYVGQKEGVAGNIAVNWLF